MFLKVFGGFRRVSGASGGPPEAPQSLPEVPGDFRFFVDFSSIVRRRRRSGGHVSAFLPAGWARHGPHVKRSGTIDREPESNEKRGGGERRRTRAASRGRPSPPSKIVGQFFVDFSSIVCRFSSKVFAGFQGFSAVFGGFRGPLDAPGGSQEAPRGPRRFFDFS